MHSCMRGRIRLESNIKNNSCTMFSFRKTKEIYHSPRTVVSDVDLEGIICGSVRFNVRAKSLENMNDPNGSNYDENEKFYFES